jgi:DNA-binding transcriptional LysR family regulator
MFDWSDLRHFLAVARRGSTLAAAKALRVSQSTVQRRLEALEAALGRRLVQRHATGYRLTKLGEEMVPYAERVEASVEEFARHFAATDPDLAGTLRVACPATAAHRLMKAGLLDAFHSRYPTLRAEFVMTEEFLDLAKGEADLAIRQGMPDDEALVARRIADVPWAVYASRAYLDRHGRPERPADLDRHAVVGFDAIMTNHAAARWMRAVAPGAAIAARGDSVPSILLAVKSGAGLAPLPMPIGSREGDLVAVIGPLPELTFPFYLVAHKDLQRTPRVRAFFDFVAAEIKTFRQVLSGDAAAAAPRLKVVGTK